MEEGNITDYHNFTNIDTPQEERRNLNIGDWYENKIQCLKCKDIIRSKNRHDYRYCKCGSIAVDGGSWYLRRIGDIRNYKELSVKFNDIKEENH